jgi:hypothetical protein
MRAFRVGSQAHEQLSREFNTHVGGACFITSVRLLTGVVMVENIGEPEAVHEVLEAGV